MKTSEKLTLIALEMVFIALVWLASLRIDLHLPVWLLLVALGFASLRLARSVSFNLVFRWLRDMLDIEERPDSSGAGDNNHATGEGPKLILGELITCPICSGTWAAAILIFSCAYLPFGELLVVVLAGAGISEVLHWASEGFQWSGRLSRELSGKYNREGIEYVRSHRPVKGVRRAQGRLPGGNGHGAVQPAGAAGVQLPERHDGPEPEPVGVPPSLR